MSRAPLELSNADARRIFIDAHGLSADPAVHSGDTLGEIRRLGFVQLDSIQNVVRAHHHILASREPGYTPAKLHALHADHRALFEHWTHDSSIIPMEFYPHWKRRFAASKKRAIAHDWWSERLGSRRILKRVRDRIAATGPMRARDFEDAAVEKGGMWNWGRSKTALEMMWHMGVLAVARRDGFEKIYDLAERVIPDDVRERSPSKAETVEWAVLGALERLGFATPREIANFWQFIPYDDIVAWLKKNRRKTIEVSVADADGKHSPVLALPGIEALRDAAPPPPPIMRALNPFDPLIRDRKRLKRLFGFDYTIEIFVPEAKRKFGYYVYPLFDGDRLVGRVDAKADRPNGTLAVRKIWTEKGVTQDSAFKARRGDALKALAGMAGLGKVSARA